jgi:hypothetical protein
VALETTARLGAVCASPILTERDRREAVGSAVDRTKGIAMLQFMDQGALASLAAIIGLVGRATWPLCSTRAGASCASSSWSASPLRPTMR